MPAIPAGLTRDQFVLALAQLNPQYTYRFLDDGSYEWRGPGNPPSDAAIMGAWTTVQTAQQAQATADAQDAVDHAALAAFDTALANYIALTSPSAPQTTAMMQAQAKAWRYLLRKLQRQGLI